MTLRYFPLARLSYNSAVLREMVYLAGSSSANDLYQEEVGVSEENRASEARTGPCPLERLQILEGYTRHLETALKKNEDVLISLKAEHALKLRNKEIENKRIVGILHEQLDDARDQLCERESQSISSIPEPDTIDESEHRQLGNRFMECDYSRDCYSDILSEAASMAWKKNYQGALVLLDANISPTDSTTLHANATLLKSCILRLNDDPKRGLELAEEVVYIANLNDLPSLLARAQLYRALCLCDLGLYADATRCYVRAASIRWYARHVADMMAAAEKERDALPSGSRGKCLSPGFQEIPLSTSAKGFGSSPVEN